MSLKQGLQAGRGRLAVIAGVFFAVVLIHTLQRPDDWDIFGHADRRAIATLAWAAISTDPTLTSAEVAAARLKASRLGVDVSVRGRSGPNGTVGIAILSALDRTLPAPPL